MKKPNKLRQVFLFSTLFFFSLIQLQAQIWQATAGPAGGDIPSMALHPTDSTIMYAVGRKDGLFKTNSYGAFWNFLPFNIEVEQSISNILINSDNPNILICSSYNDLLKSSDAGLSWKQLNNGINAETKFIDVLINDPIEADKLYFGGGSHAPEFSPTVYMSTNNGENWTDIASNLTLPYGVHVSSICSLGNGKIYIGVNDETLELWGKGKVFYTMNEGASWSEVDFGQSENRFVKSIHANAHDLTQIWISEGPIYNTLLDPPYLYVSDNSGTTWNAKTFGISNFDTSQMRIIGSSANSGNLYIASGGNLYVSRDSGASLEEITCPQEILRFDLFHVYEQVSNSDKIFLPTGANGIAYSPDSGSSWRVINNGILNTSINLLSVDPNNSGVVFASSSKGEGLFKSSDYGEHWEILNKNGIVHQWADELLVDPTNSENVWYISDVPYIHKSENAGDDWNLVNNPYEADNFSFSSVYAVAQSDDNNIIYAVNNGFGIFKGTKQWPDESYHWEFLNTSDIDYTYTLEVEPDNENILYSGYNKKPFEDTAMIRASYNAGEEWFTSLIVPNAEGITSVEIDPLNKNNVMATSVGKEGILWKSEDKGQNWNVLNQWFNFTTIHSYATNGNTAYAATWGGGMYKTSNNGLDWVKLESEECNSAATVVIQNDNADFVWIADRTHPLVFKSTDGGSTWDTVFNAGSDYRRIMNLELDPHNNDQFYVTAMDAQGSGMTGDLFKVENEQMEVITNGLSRLVLKVKASPTNPLVLYTVLHESGVYKSEDGGSSWSNLSDTSSGLPNSGFNDIVIDPNNSNTLYLLGGSDVRFSTIASAGMDADIVFGVYKSTNGGETWENINHGVLGTNSGSIKSMTFVNNSSQQIYLSAENGVFYSLDGGVNWVEEVDLPYKTLGGLSVFNDVIQVYTMGAGVISGTINADHSIAWNSKAGFKNKIDFAQLIKHPTEASILYASAYPGGIFKSFDYGETWHERNFGIPSFKVDDPLREGYYALDINADNPDIMYLGLYKRGVYRSFNGGDTWYPVNGKQWEMSIAAITCLVSDNTDENTVYVGTLNGLYKTTDGGTSWTEFNEGMGKKEIRSISMNTRGNLNVGTKGHGLYTLFENKWIANEGFGNWGTSWPMWDGRPMYQYTSLLIHPEDNQRMMLGTFPQGIYLSNDGGVSWHESNIGWTNDGVFRLVCHPENPEIVYAGTYNGLNISYDFGHSWQMSNEGWPEEQWVFSIDFDPSNPDIMYACSKNGENEGRGVEDFYGTVMKSTNAGKSWSSITNGLDQGQEFYQIICDHFHSGVLYLSSQHDGLFRSSDSGNSWEAFNSGLVDMNPGTNGNNVTNTLVLSDDNSVLYYGTAGTGVFRSLLLPILSAQELKAVPRGEEIQLNWQFTDIAENFKKFKIYRSKDEIDDVSTLIPIREIIGADTLIYLDTEVEYGELYYYAVTVVNYDDYETENYPTAGPVGVSDSNNPPELIIALVDQETTVGTSFIYNIAENSFVDPDQDVLTYNAFEAGKLSLPAWLLFDNDELSFYGTPTIIDIGEFNIQVEASDPFDSKASDDFIIKVESGVGIDALEQKPLNIYPIPSNSFITIEDFSTDENYNVVIYDLSSKKVMSTNDFAVYTYHNKIQIDVNQLQNGIYILLAKSKSTEIMRKIIIRH